MQETWPRQYKSMTDAEKEWVGENAIAVSAICNLLIVRKSSDLSSRLHDLTAECQVATM